MSIPIGQSQPHSNMTTVDILILGAGWTSAFLIPLCAGRFISYAATSRPSHSKPDTIPFEFEENDANPDKEQFQALPDARTVLITFPITAKGASERLVRMYEKTRAKGSEGKTRWIQLGSTRIWEINSVEIEGSDSNIWLDRHSPINKTNARAAAEEELLALSPGTPTTVLNLAGLWGGVRQAKRVIGRVAPTKEALKNRGSLHMIHGEDVSRAILAIHDDFDKATGERWLLTDKRVHDWWDLVHAWGIRYATSDLNIAPEEPSEQELLQKQAGKGPHPEWVQELMKEAGIRTLPRSIEKMGRALDSQDFWNTFQLEPVMGRLE